MYRLRWKHVAVLWAPVDLVWYQQIFEELREISNFTVSICHVYFTEQFYFSLKTSSTIFVAEKNSIIKNKFILISMNFLHFYSLTFIFFPYMLVCKHYLWMNESWVYKVLLHFFKLYYFIKFYFKSFFRSNQIWKLCFCVCV